MRVLIAIGSHACDLMEQWYRPARRVETDRFSIDNLAFLIQAFSSRMASRCHLTASAVVYAQVTSAFDMIVLSALRVTGSKEHRPFPLYVEKLLEHAFSVPQLLCITKYGVIRSRNDVMAMFDMPLAKLMQTYDVRRIAPSLQVSGNLPVGPVSASSAPECPFAFISYATPNKDKADALRALLHENGVRTWMAPYDIPVGQKYAQVIDRALEHCACMVLLLSEDAQSSPFVTREVDRAVAYRKSILTLKLEDLVLNREFSFYIAVDHIVPLRTIDATSPETQKVLDSIRAMVNS